MKTTPRSLLLRYGLSVCASLLALALRGPLRPVLGDTAPYIQNYPAVMLAAWYGGLGPGLLTTALTALFTAYPLLPPHPSVALPGAPHILTLAMFLMIGGVISGLNEALHRIRRETEERIRTRTADLSVANEILQEEIRERRRAEEQLERSSEQIRDLYNRAPCGYHSLDENGVFVRINDTELSWLGYTREEMVGRLAFPNLLTKEDRERFYAIFPRFRAEGTSIRDLEFVLHRKDGTPFPVLINSDAVRDEEGRYLYSRTTLHDLSDRKRLEGLSEAHRYKDQFLAVLGHELRSPLGAISNSLYVLRYRNAGNPSVIRACEVMDRQLRHMVRLVDDLRDVSRLNRGVMEIRKERLDLCGVIVQSIETVRPLIEERGHRLEVSLPPSCPVEGDPERLAQVFTNLLNNAAKYTDPGGEIRLGLEMNDARATVTVRDTGMGIPGETLPRIFHLYAQADSALSRSQGGLGIGLSLVKGIVEMHDGSVTASSDGPGRGSVFGITLPLADS